MSKLVYKHELTQDVNAIESLYETPTTSPIFRGKLTKRLLFQLPTGSYIVSNLGMPGFGLSAHHRVPSIEERDALWRSLKQAGVDGRLFTLFNNKTAYLEHVRFFQTGVGG